MIERKQNWKHISRLLLIGARGSLLRIVLLSWVLWYTQGDGWFIDWVGETREQCGEVKQAHGNRVDIMVCLPVGVDPRQYKPLVK